MITCEKIIKQKITRTRNVDQREGNFLNKAEMAANTKPHRKQMTIDENERINDSDKEAYNHNQRSKQKDDDNDDSLDNGGSGDDKNGDV